MSRYVLCKNGYRGGYVTEMYVKAVKGVKDPVTTWNATDAMGFMTAADAYTFGTKFRLDDWKAAHR